MQKHVEDVASPSQLLLLQQQQQHYHDLLRGRFAKVGWARKSGVMFRPTSSAIEASLSDADISSMVSTMLPSALTAADLLTSTNIKTRFLMLSEFRLQYGSTSCYELYKKTGDVASTAAKAGVVLGEIFLTGDAWMRTVGEMSLIVHGDTAMQRKVHKHYLLTFRSTDERTEWEFAIQFFLRRTVPSERFERLLLSGWISAFPALSNRMDKMTTRRMSVFRFRKPSIGSTSSATAAASEENTNKSTNKGDHADDEDEEGGVLGEVVSEGSDSASSHDEEEGNNSSDNEASNQVKGEITRSSGGGDDERAPLMKRTSASAMRKTRSDVSSMLFSLLHNQLVQRKDESGGGSADDGGGSPSSTGVALPPVVKFSLDEINTNGASFLLRCQRPSLLIQGRLHRPDPTYLSVVWLRASHTVTAVPSLKETVVAEYAARFAIRSFAEGGGSLSLPRVILVDAPNWQLYTRSGGGRQRTAEEEATRRTEETERELILVPVFSTFSHPSPTVLAGGGASSSGSSPSKQQHISGGENMQKSTSTATPIPTPYRSFSAIGWEGSRAPCGDDDDSKQQEEKTLATFSFLLNAQLVAGGPSASTINKKNNKRHIVALAPSGKIFLIPEDHPDAALMGDDDDESGGGGGRGISVGSLNSFVAVEVVPTLSDAHHLFAMTHQTPAMRQRLLYRAANRDLCLSFTQERLIEPMRLVFVGASRVGKSTIARWISRYSVQTAQKLDTNKKNVTTYQQQQQRPSSLPLPSGKEGEGGLEPSGASAAEDASRAVLTVHANGIAVPVVITEVPSTANGALIRTQCESADLVICLFDMSDDHTLQWLESNLSFICASSSSSAAAISAEGDDDGALKKKKERSAASSATAASASAEAATRYVLCATRTDSLRLAVDSYRLESFLQQTVQHTGSVDKAWKNRLVDLTSCLPASSTTDAAAAAAALEQQPSLGMSFTSASMLSEDGEEAAAPPPFSGYGARWRHWKLNTVTTPDVVISSGLDCTQALGLGIDESLSEAFLMSPQLRKIAAEGMTLQLPRALISGNGHQQHNSTPHRGFGDASVAAEQQQQRQPTTPPPMQQRCGFDTNNAMHLNEEEEAISKCFLTSLSGALEELYLDRLGATLGWDSDMLTYFASATYQASVSSSASSSSSRDAAVDIGGAVSPAASRKKDEAKLLLELLRLPALIQFDAVEEVLHVPRRSSTAAPSSSSLLLSPQTQPNNNSLIASHTLDFQNSSMSDASSSMLRSPSTAFMNVSTPMSKFSASTPQVRPSRLHYSQSPWFTLTSVSAIGTLQHRELFGGRDHVALTSPHQRSHLFDGEEAPILLLDLSKRKVDDPLTHTAARGSGGSTRVVTFSGPDTSSSATSHPPMLISPSLSHRRFSASTAVASARRAPTWKELVSSTVSSWAVHWLVLRWLNTGYSLGDPRCELIMCTLKGEVSQWHQRRRGGHSGGGGEKERLKLIVPTLAEPLIDEVNRKGSSPLLSASPSRGRDTMDESDSTSGSNDDSAADRRPGGDNSTGQNQRERTTPKEGNQRRHPIAMIQQRHGGGGGGVSFHPVHLLFVVQGHPPPQDKPPKLIAHAALWLYKQATVSQSSSGSIKGGGGGGPNPVASSNLLRHVTPALMLSLFRLGGVELTRPEHGGALLRWADTNADRVTDATDFVRWFSQLLAVDLPHLPPHLTGGGGGGGANPAGSGGSSSKQQQQPPPQQQALQQRPQDPTTTRRWILRAAAASSANASAFAGAWMSLLSIHWAMRMLREASMLESLTVMQQSGLPRDRCWTLAAFATAARIPAAVLLDLVSSRSGGVSRTASSTFAGSSSTTADEAANGADAWDTVDDHPHERTRTTLQSPLSATSKPGVAKDKKKGLLMRVAAALALSSPRREKGKRDGDGDDTYHLDTFETAAATSSSSASSAYCAACRSIFRPIIRPKTVCQECTRCFCSRCCTTIVVLNERNMTERRRLCGQCRRAQSTFMGDASQPQNQQQLQLQQQQQQQKLLLQQQQQQQQQSSLLHTASSAIFGTSLSRGGADFTTEDGGTRQWLDEENPMLDAQQPVVWEDDTQTSCSLCASAFTVLRRRHHCRSCGALVCATCSASTMLLPGFTGPQRVCSSCKQARVALSNAASPMTPPEASGGGGGGGGVSAFQEKRSDTRSAISGDFDLITTADETRQQQGGGAEQQQHATSSRPREGSRFSSAGGGGGGGGGTPSAGTRSVIGDMDDRRVKKRQRWMQLKDDVPISLTWRERHTHNDEYEVIRIGKEILEERMKIIHELSVLPGGLEALQAEQGAQWRYAVHQPGYTEHDATLERTIDMAMMMELGPDVGPH